MTVVHLTPSVTHAHGLRIPIPTDVMSSVRNAVDQRLDRIGLLLNNSVSLSISDAS